MTKAEKRKAKRIYKQEHNFRKDRINRYFINPYTAQPYSTYGIKKAEEFLEWGLLEVSRAVYDYFRIRNMRETFKDIYKIKK